MSLSSIVLGEVLSFLCQGVSVWDLRGVGGEGKVMVPSGLLGFYGEGEFDLLFLWEMVSTEVGDEG